MTTHLQAVHTYQLHQDVTDAPVTPETHAAIAAEAIEHAKGGHVVALAIGKADPVMVYPGESAEDVTWNVGQAMPVGEPEVAEAEQTEGSQRRTKKAKADPATF